jgi:YidC/Oxa1 family membrane protein insertase
LDNNRGLLLAIVLSLGVVVLWQWLFPSAPAHPRVPVPVAQAAATSGASGSSGAAAPPPAVSSAVVTPPAAATTAAGNENPVAGSTEQQVVLSNGQIKATFSSRGAELLSMTIVEPSARHDREEMVRSRAQGPYPYALVDKNRKPLPVNDALFQVVRPDAQSVVFRYRGSAGDVQKRFVLDPRGLLEADVKAAGGWGLYLGPGIRNLSEQELSSRLLQQGGVYRRGDDTQVLNPRGEFDLKEVNGAGLRFVGLEDTYFVSMNIPAAGLGRAVFQPFLVQPTEKGPRFIPVPPKDQITSEEKDLNREYALILEPTADELSLLSYWGGKNYEQLKSFGLEGTVQLGRFGLIVLPLLASLHWIYDHVVPNYGWAIVLLTVVIKLLLLPLTHQGMMSMRKMQALNPQMQAVRDRYKSKLKDKQGRPNLEMQKKMNEEVMALYKREGVNPAGGCLPMVLQLPILYAFYQLLSIAVELRHAPWLLWIHDLTAADPFYLLPLIMGATQFLQVYWSPQGGDPTQRRLFLIMPLAMVVFFIRQPSGLVLYWLTNNVLTIAQQAVYNRMAKKPAT